MQDGALLAGTAAVLHFQEARVPVGKTTAFVTCGGAAVGGAWAVCSARW
jgi:hypothetical protein